MGGIHGAVGHLAAGQNDVGRGGAGQVGGAQVGVAQVAAGQVGAVQVGVAQVVTLLIAARPVHAYRRRCIALPSPRRCFAFDILARVRRSAGAQHAHHYGKCRES
jgi:hypothetical protein